MEKIKDGQVPEGKKQWEFTRYKNKVQCLFTVQREGTKYCDHHAYLDTDEFVKCPVDPSHSVKKAKLEKHVKKCNRTKDIAKLEQNEWYSKDINVVDPSFKLDSVRKLTSKLIYRNAKELEEVQWWRIRLMACQNRRSVQ